jgi:hypothetical protein
LSSSPKRFFLARIRATGPTCTRDSLSYIYACRLECNQSSTIKLNNQGVGREAYPECESEELLWPEVSSCARSEENSHHRPSRSDAQKDGGHLLVDGQSRTTVASTTNTAAGTMCASVRAACEENVALSVAICGGFAVAGRDSATSLRTTAAMAIPTLVQNPNKSHMGRRTAFRDRSNSFGDM